MISQEESPQIENDDGSQLFSKRYHYFDTKLSTALESNKGHIHNKPCMIRITAQYRLNIRQVYEMLCKLSKTTNIAHNNAL